MTGVSIIPAPPLQGMRLAFVLREDRLGHYAEFRDFFVRSFELDRVGLAQPGYLRASSGMTYALIFIGRSGEAFPCGLEIHTAVPALEPLDEAQVDRDLWAILRWVVEGVGGAWTIEALQATGRLFRIPAADDPAAADRAADNPAADDHLQG
ncbi:MAG TPA: hypothetical protein VMB34_20680 [Acetobacteraceae bacterium]|nr:hypothetical protein [Acetobacteraceae bacterium]